MEVSPKSGLVAIAYANGRVRVVIIDTWEAVKEFSFPEPEQDSSVKLDGEVEPLRVRFSPDGRVLAVSHLSRIYAYDVSTWQAAGSLGIEGEDTMRPIVPVPELMRRSDHEPPQSENPAEYQAREWHKRRQMGDGRTRITDFAFTKDNRFIVASYSRGSCFDQLQGISTCDAGDSDPLRLWELATGRIAWEFVYGSDRVAGRVRPSPDGTRCIVAVKAKGRWWIHGHEMRSGGEMYSVFVSKGLDTPDIFFLPSGEEFFSLWDPFPPPPEKHGQRPKRILWKFGIFDVSDGSKVGEFSDKEQLSRAALSPDGRLLAATSWGSSCFKLYDVPSRRALNHIIPFKARGSIAFLRFATDGKRVLAVDSRKWRLALFEIENR